MTTKGAFSKTTVNLIGATTPKQMTIVQSAKTFATMTLTVARLSVEAENAAGGKLGSVIQRRSIHATFTRVRKDEVCAVIYRSRFLTNME